jgi:hypothetical protein
MEISITLLIVIQVMNLIAIAGMYVSKWSLRRRLEEEQKIFEALVEEYRQAALHVRAHRSRSEAGPVMMVLMESIRGLRLGKPSMTREESLSGEKH